MSSKASRIALVAFISLTCVVDVLWIHANVAPPRMYDDAVYLADSVNLFATLQNRGFVPFLRECLEATKGHPPMIKILPVASYLLFGPGTASALYAYIPLIVIFCIYLFVLTRTLGQSDEIAFIAVAVTVLFPLTFGLWRNMMAEFGTTVAVIACIYHLLRSDAFRIRNHVLLFGACFGWGLLWKISFPVFVAGPLLSRVTYQSPAQPSHCQPRSFRSRCAVDCRSFLRDWRQGSCTLCEDGSAVE